MMAIMKREIRNYLKRPLFWLGVLLVIYGVYQDVKPYLKMHYVTDDRELEEMVRGYPETVPDADPTDGYVPAKETERRALWEETMWEWMTDYYEMTAAEAEAAIEGMQGMEIREACDYLEQECQIDHHQAFLTYWETAYRQGTKEEINAYVQEKLGEHRFSYYFSRKFADFAGLYMGFFATFMLAALYWQDTRKNTYALLHTKPVSAGRYVLGKAAGGLAVCLIVLAILNLVFFTACRILTEGSGFVIQVRLTDFLAATARYILPNMLMIVCVYSLISLLFQNPLPAVPLLILDMVYSNMGKRNADGVFVYVGRPFAIMVRFPGNFFETVEPPMVVQNQSLLVLASAVILLFCVWLWKRRRL